MVEIHPGHYGSGYSEIWNSPHITNILLTIKFFYSLSLYIRFVMAQVPQTSQHNSTHFRSQVSSVKESGNRWSDHCGLLASLLQWHSFSHGHQGQPNFSACAVQWQCKHTLVRKLKIHNYCFITQDTNSNKR